jgi:hypothetical protein
MRPTDGAELDHLLGEQLAYYRALAADYLDLGLRGRPGRAPAPVGRVRPSGRANRGSARRPGPPGGGPVAGVVERIGGIGLIESVCC